MSRGRGRNRPLIVLALSVVWTAAAADERGTARYFEEIKESSALLRVFLNGFPKGADLHNHLDGSIYAETYIAWAAEDGKCVDRNRLTLSLPPCDQADGETLLSDVVSDVPTVNRLIDAFSVRNYERRSVSGHDQFFGSFSRFFAATIGREGDMLLDAANRAGRQNVVYLELMHIWGMEEAIAIGSNNESFGNLDNLDQLINSAALDELVAKAIVKTNDVESRLEELLHCDREPIIEGCNVSIRYLSTVLRSFSKAEVAAQALLAFKLADRDPRYVGINFVMPEDMPSILSTYSWQMTLVRKLGEEFPLVQPNITLHAGELAMGLVPPHDLQFHVTEAVNVANARRIGHATSIMYEKDVETLLSTMADRDILVEINLTSNAIILGVTGDGHPFELLRSHDVPVALSTDDEGVARIDLTHEYQRAVETFDLSYADIKELSRNSLAYSFLPGPGLFADVKKSQKVEACRNVNARGGHVADACGHYLSTSPKAQAQWDLEERFHKFETAH